MKAELGHKFQGLAEFTVSRALASVFWMDEEGKIYYANETAKSVYGYSEEEFKQLSIFQINREFTDQRFRMLWAESKKKGKLHLESAHWRNDGTRFPVEIFVNHLQFEGQAYNVSFVLDITHRKRKEQLLTSVSRATSSTMGVDFFKSLVENITQALGVHMCLITQLDPSEKDTLKTLAYYKDGDFVENTSYHLDGTPCKQVIHEKRPLHQLVGVSSDYPKEVGIEGYFGVPILSRQGDCLGLIGLFDNKPLDLLDEEKEIIRMFSDRAAVELERNMANEKLLDAMWQVEDLKNKLEAENTYLQQEIQGEHNFHEIITQSIPFKALLANLEQVAVTDATVLITGESGTGKELLARAIHDISPRSNRPLVKVNCAVLPANLIESELFGHEKGAFTGAISRKVGRFELADQGTLFLDEIGELPLELQSKLLRALQEGEFERLGSTQTKAVNVRVIAATNRQLEKEVTDGAFRADLYYRLNVFPVHSLPLRERKEDIGLLVKHFVQKFGANLGKRITNIPKRAMNVLLAYDWPGNIRELENVIERAVILSPENKLELGDWIPKKNVVASVSDFVTLAEFEKRYIMDVLQRTAWRVSGEKGAAKILGMKPTTLESRMKKLGIKRGL
ncbi:sigma 54-interacting transcriptional regulator [Roseivirga pacifica]|uniref:sigma 54-interacting transcriptional regulator n=1 Tax=Roseivirga pacifica TaxID=1267423 RepID=UPI00227D01A0|nr:sigma 54-interacting transcriptional regulator [Roseivirga pacifica]